MDQQPERKPIKIGVREGDGPPPGYQWTVDILDQAYAEAMSFLTKEQYHHVAAQFRDLAKEADPTRSPVIDVRTIDGFYELRDKGGVLKRINVRVFFCISKKPVRKIIVLGAINKKNDGRTPVYVRILMDYRMRRYLAQNCSDEEC
jgi:hypothetical protein